VYFYIQIQGMSMKKILLCCFIALAMTALQAQENNGISLMTKHHLEEFSASGRDFPMIVEGSLADIQHLCKLNHAQWLYSHGTFHRINVPVEKVATFIHQPEVKRWQDLANPITRLMDSARILNNVDSIHHGYAPLSGPYTGRGVIMGIIDDGIDFTHPDFKWATGHTRIKYLWDQNLAASAASPAPYNYGQEWDAAQIDAGACGHREQGSAGHGSHVSGIAAGNGAHDSTKRGIAPNTDLIVVSANYGSSFESDVVDAVDYIYKKADALGQPCVINTSLGTYYGSHDGHDLTSKMIEALLDERAGRVLVGAAGNAGNIPMHLGHAVTADTSFTWFKDYAWASNIYFDLWADTQNFSQVYFGVGGIDRSFTNASETYMYQVNRNFSTVFLSGTASTIRTIYDRFSRRLGVLQISVSLDENRYHIEFLVQADSANYYWHLKTTGSGKFDLWADRTVIGTSNFVTSALPTAADYSAIVNYKLPDTRSTTVSSWQCSDKIITVGNYVNRESFLNHDSTYTHNGLTPGSLFFTSSLGPTRDGRTKPDIAATGATVLACGNLYWLSRLISSGQGYKVAYGDYYVRNSGTSMASPQVAGVVALYLEKNPTYNYHTIKEILIKTARQDSFTIIGGVPNNSWGYGKLNGFATMTFNAIPGCTDTGSINYNPSANVTDGSCIAKVYGCTDSTAANYNPLANVHDTCIYNPVGMDALLKDGKIKVYPNPANDVCSFSRSSGDWSTAVDIFLYNQLGQLMRSFQIATGADHVNLNVHEWQAGIYTYKAFENGQEKGFGKLMIK